MSIRNQIIRQTLWACINHGTRAATAAFRAEPFHEDVDKLINNCETVILALIPGADQPTGTVEAIEIFNKILNEGEIVDAPTQTQDPG